MKRDIPLFHAMAWAKAVLNASSLTCNAIELAFMPFECRRNNGAKIDTPRHFNKYLYGESAPKKEGCKCSGMEFVNRIEAVYPGTKAWLELDLWKLVTDDKLDLLDIWEKMSKCKIHNYHQFFEYDSNNHPLRTSTVTKKKLLKLIEKSPPIEAITFLIGLLRESERLINIRQHLLVIKTIKELIPKISEIPEFSDFLGRFFDFLEMKYFRVIYNIPDTGMNLIVTDSWRDQYPEISKKTDEKISDSKQNINSRKTYRSFYRAPSNSPTLIDLTGNQVKLKENLDKLFSK